MSKKFKKSACWITYPATSKKFFLNISVGLEKVVVLNTVLF